MAGRSDFFNRRYEAAIAQFRSALELDTDYRPARFFIAEALIEQDKHKEALKEIQTGVPAGREQAFSRLTGRLYALMGSPTEAQKIIDQLLAMSKERYVSACAVAQIYASLGDKKQALDWLEKAADEKDRVPAYLKVDPAYDGLKKEPRYLHLLQRMNLADKTPVWEPAIRSVAVL